MTSNPNLSPTDNRSNNIPPPRLPNSQPKSGTFAFLLAIALTLFLGLFLADAFVSLADDSLILLFGIHVISATRAALCFFAMLIAVVIYGLMGLTPMIPKRWFLPLTLYYPVTQLAILPCMIYSFGRITQANCFFSFIQVVLGVAILYRIQGRFKLQWLLVPADRLTGRGFSWGNLSIYVLANIFLLLPATFLYLFVCSAMTVDHFTDGFMTLHPDGLRVQVRKYVRDDGKIIELFPMAHVADAGFYGRVSRTFPTNSIILMEGVRDSQNLLTNGISYRHMAKFLGLTEQKVTFGHGRGKMVGADIDVNQFSKNTIDCLNLVMLLHAQGLNSGSLLKLMEYSPPPHIEQDLYEDLLTKRNQHLLKEIQSHLAETDNIMVPWGAGHMPGIARGIQDDGFRPVETNQFMAIHFRKRTEN